MSLRLAIVFWYSATLATVPPPEGSEQAALKAAKMLEKVYSAIDSTTLAQLPDSVVQQTPADSIGNVPVCAMEVLMSP